MDSTPWRVDLSRRAEKDLDKLPAADARRILVALESLAREPFRRSNADVKKLQGENFIYRLRVGSYRATYELQRRTRTLQVLKILDRKDAY